MNGLRLPHLSFTLLDILAKTFCGSILLEQTNLSAVWAITFVLGNRPKADNVNIFQAHITKNHCVMEIEKAQNIVVSCSCGVFHSKTHGI